MENRGEKPKRAGDRASTMEFTKFAAAEMPMIPGSVKGFFITACKRVPDVARDAPAKMAIKTRGKRKS